MFLFDIDRVLDWKHKAIGGVSLSVYHAREAKGYENFHILLKYDNNIIIWSRLW